MYKAHAPPSYDFLAFACIGNELSSIRSIVLASLLAYAIANTVGFAMVSGTSVRYRPSCGMSRFGSVAQLGVSRIDWMLATAVFCVLSSEAVLAAPIAGTEMASGDGGSWRGRRFLAGTEVPGGDGGLALPGSARRCPKCAALRRL